MSTLKANNKPIDKTSVEKKSAVELKLLANSNGDEEDAMSAVNKQRIVRFNFFCISTKLTNFCFFFFIYFSLIYV